MITDHLTDFERDLKVLGGLQGSSTAIYVAKVRRFSQWLAEENRPCDPGAITRKDIEDYLEHCFYQGNSNETRLTKLVAIRKFVRYLLYRGLITEDPSALIPKPKIKRRFIQRFTQAEIMRIFSAIDLHTEKAFRDFVIIMVAAFAGPRLDEILSLTLEDVVDAGKSLDLHFIGKFEKERQVYLWKVPSDILRIWLAIRISHRARPSDPLFVSYCRGSVPKGRRLTHSAVDLMLKARARAASVRKPKVSMHMLRATHASDLRHIHGYDTSAIAERLGHESIATTDRYMPSRERIHRIYPSLAAYWEDFATLWNERRDKSVAKSITAYGGTPDV